MARAGRLRSAVPLAAATLERNPLRVKLPLFIVVLFSFLGCVDVRSVLSAVPALFNVYPALLAFVKRERSMKKKSIQIHIALNIQF
jgi:hypothetical protein